MYPIISWICSACLTVSNPETLIDPSVGNNNPPIKRIKVVFPAPSGPAKPTIFPLGITACIWLRAANGWGGKNLDRLRMSTKTSLTCFPVDRTIFDEV